MEKKKNLGEKFAEFDDKMGEIVRGFWGKRILSLFYILFLGVGIFTGQYYYLVVSKPEVGLIVGAIAVIGMVALWKWEGKVR